MRTNILDEHRAAEALVDASMWPGHGVNVGSAEDTQEKQETRRLIELFQRSVGHIVRACRVVLIERSFECPGGLWRPGIRFFSLLACH